MSEVKRISPLLDGFAMGNPISEHSGIRCCPAIKENTDKKYIVKIISIPASQTQLDALLLAGAYKDPSGAMEYFQEKCQEVLAEAELLKKLSGLDGFLSYESWQMEPITRHRLGYEIYLLGSYKRSLERYMKHNAITHLEAINLGLDMCSALSVCRNAGALYVDLKPSNIFMSEKKEYRIGDLGFLKTAALRYTALPEKYQSRYTPPELFDPMANVNMTADTYALGMILYQLYNDGILPFKGKAPEGELPSPVHADYELAEIIMKAIHSDPAQRWQDPAEMGKALAAYMQRNSVNDIAITPLRTKLAKSKKKQKEAPPVLPDALDASFEPVQDEALISEPETEAPQLPETEKPVEPEAEPQPPEEIQTEPDEQPVAPEEEPFADPEPEEAIPEETTREQEEILPPEPEDALDRAVQTVVEQISDSAPEPPQLSAELPDEFSRVIAKANDLMVHEVPSAEDVLEMQPDLFAFAQDEEEIDDSDIPYDPLMDEESEPVKKEKKRREKKFADPKYKRRRKRVLSAILAILLLILAGCGGFWYYQNKYVQTIDSLTITGSKDQITVVVDTTASEDLLRVTCQDSYGHAKTQRLTEGQTVFTGLKNNTTYTIQLEIEGFHGLVGTISDVFTTEAATNIVSFTSVAGAEDGSVILNFTVDGDEPPHWVLSYTAEGEPEQRDTFTGHTTTVKGLSLGKVYTFTLLSGNDTSLSGQTTLELMASRLILAENLSVSSGNGTDMTVHWDAPGDIVVDSWDVRCYNEMGYDQQYTVLETEVMFTGIDPSKEYTIEVTASGMTQPARTGITANPVSITACSVDESKADQLTVNWEFIGDMPEGGWLLLYSMNGSENNVVKTTKPTAVITPKVPGGNYVFQIQSADGTTIFNNLHKHAVAEGAPFDANALTTDMLTIDLLKTPEGGSWYFENISSDQLTDTFKAGDQISIALRSSDSFYLPGAQTKVLYVIEDSFGNIMAQHTQEETIVWKSIWSGGDSKNGELNVPSVPGYPGEFSLKLYFDGMLVTELPFTIVE